MGPFVSNRLKGISKCLATVDRIVIPIRHYYMYFTATVTDKWTITKKRIASESRVESTTPGGRTLDLGLGVLLC